MAVSLGVRGRFGERSLSKTRARELSSGAFSCIHRQEHSFRRRCQLRLSTWTAEGSGEQHSWSMSRCQRSALDMAPLPPPRDQYAQRDPLTRTSYRHRAKDRASLAAWQRSAAPEHAARPRAGQNPKGRVARGSQRGTRAACAETRAATRPASVLKPKRNTSRARLDGSTRRPCRALVWSGLPWLWLLAPARRRMRGGGGGGGGGATSTARVRWRSGAAPSSAQPALS